MSSSPPFSYPTGERSLLRIVGHSDPALDAQGREVLIYQDIDTDHISTLDLASGTVTPLWPIDFSHTPIGLHFSGRAFYRPGWALVPTVTAQAYLTPPTPSPDGGTDAIRRGGVDFSPPLLSPSPLS